MVCHAVVAAWNCQVPWESIIFRRWDFRDGHHLFEGFRMPGSHRACSWPWHLGLLQVSELKEAFRDFRFRSARSWIPGNLVNKKGGKSEFYEAIFLLDWILTWLARWQKLISFLFFSQSPLILVKIWKNFISETIYYNFKSGFRKKFMKGEFTFFEMPQAYCFIPRVLLSCAEIHSECSARIQRSSRGQQEFPTVTWWEPWLPLALLTYMASFSSPV